MNTSKKPLEFADLGRHLIAARQRRGLTQGALAAATGLPQSTISRIEQRSHVPSLIQLTAIGKALNVSLQWFISGSNRPGQELPDIAAELQDLGIVDLFVPDARLPAAFRNAEEVVALAAAGDEPEPRIIEALPAVLAWNRWNVPLLRTYSLVHDRRSLHRLAWLANIALTIHKNQGFPGGCAAKKELAAFMNKVQPPKLPDGLGRAVDDAPLPPISKHWKITYPADLATFRRRAEQLAQLAGRDGFSLDHRRGG